MMTREIQLTAHIDAVPGSEHFTVAEKQIEGEVVLCGSLSTQLGAAADRLPGPDRDAALARGVELLPFSCHHTPGQVAAWHHHFRTPLDRGRFVYPRTVVETGTDGVPGAFLATLRGEYRGNVSVRLA